MKIILRSCSCLVVLLLSGFIGAPGTGLSAQDRAAAAGQSTSGKDPCATPANKIAAENCKTGNPSTEWDVHGSGDPDIQGFATEISVNVGDTQSFKIRTHSAKYRIDIYRLGYYQGKGARLIETIRPSSPLPQAQPECLTDPATRLYDCGNWAVSASWKVPANGTSGVYIARLVREDGEPPTWRAENAQFPPKDKPPSAPQAYGASGLGTLRNALKEKRASLIVFIVRDDNSRSDVLMQTSDQAWTTYNRDGGSSTYGSWIQGAAAGRPFRAFKVSYNRPNSNREWNIVNQIFNAEYPMIRWLEANGYNVSYFAGVDGARRGEKIKEHKIFLSVGHDEYWSGEQRKKVEAARDAGVNLAFFSGNEVFWKIRYEPSIDGSNTPYRTIVCYKETHSDMKIDPKRDEWTGTWRDSRWFNPEGAQPENALTGTIFTVNGYRNDPLIVLADYAKLRFWRNTEVATLKSGEKAVLGDGILGHEWDENLDNGFRPAGIIELSSTTVNGVPYIQDFGTIYDSGTATHHLTLYRAKSGALVFGAGTVQWSWGLDSFHDNWTGVAADQVNRYSIRVGYDQKGPVKAIQQATVNLFADMGVQPSNLQPGLVPVTQSSDATGPVAKIVSPTDGAIASLHAVTITGTAADVGGVVAAVEVSTDRGSTWHAATGTSAWTYEFTPSARGGRIQVVARATDDSANIGPISAPLTLRIGTTTTP